MKKILLPIVIGLVVLSTISCATANPFVAPGAAPAATSAPAAPVVQTVVVPQTVVVQLPPVTTAPPAPTNPPPPPAATTASVANVLTIAQFAQIWSSTPTNPPGPMIIALDSLFDSSGGTIGGQSRVPKWRVPAGSVVWTNTFCNQPMLANGSRAANDKEWVFLRTEGCHGVYYAYADLVLPSPGRYAKTERWLNPCRDLSGWGAC